MANEYKGKIINLNHDAGCTSYKVIEFVSTEKGTKGLSIFINYILKNQQSSDSFESGIRSRFEKNEEGIPAEVILTEPIRRECLEYIANGPIRFIEDK